MTPCVLWEGSTKDGYGRTCGPTRRRAHVVAFEEKHGPVPAGKMILHMCGVRLCVNPEHLYAGDHSDNMRDYIRHGGQPTSRPHIQYRHRDIYPVAKALFQMGYTQAWVHYLTAVPINTLNKWVKKCKVG